MAAREGEDSGIAIPCKTTIPTPPDDNQNYPLMEKVSRLFTMATLFPPGVVSAQIRWNQPTKVSDPDSTTPALMKAFAFTLWVSAINLATQS